MEEIMTETLANLYRPSRWEDFSGQDYAVSTLRGIIAQGRYDEFRAILLYGSPGSGKSSIARMYYTALLCHNRQEGDDSPCGECPVCLGTDTANITYYTVSNPAEAKEMFKRLIDISRQVPAITSDGVQHRVIIVDEFELVTPELAAMILDPLEHGSPHTTWIIISMDWDKLERSNPAVAEATASRSARIALNSLSDSSIANTLVRYTDELDYEAAMAIAKLSEGNMREAWSTLQLLSVNYKPEELTEELVLSIRVGTASKHSREQMWLALGRGDSDKVKEIVKGWKISSHQLLGDLLEEDIIDNMQGVDKGVMSLLACIGRWKKGHYSPLLAILLTHLGTQVVRPKPVAIPANNVVELVAKVLKQKPLLFTTTSYKELLAAYAS